jgi:acyl-CoA thioesterase YciA
MSARPTTEPVIRVVAMPADTNPHGDIFGGWLMSLMDVGAGTVAMRVCNGRAVTVAVDGMQFLAPVAVGDEVSVFGTLLATGRTSITIAVEAWRRLRDGDVSEKVTAAKFTFVAIDDHGRPRAINSGPINL